MLCGSLAPAFSEGDDLGGFCMWMFCECFHCSCALLKNAENAGCKSHVIGLPYAVLTLGSKLCMMFHRVEDFHF